MALVRSRIMIAMLGVSIKKYQEEMRQSCGEIPEIEKGGSAVRYVDHSGEEATPPGRWRKMTQSRLSGLTLVADGRHRWGLSTLLVGRWWPRRDGIPQW